MNTNEEVEPLLTESTSEKGGKRGSFPTFLRSALREQRLNFFIRLSNSKGGYPSTQGTIGIWKSASLLEVFVHSQAYQTDTEAFTGLSKPVPRCTDRNIGLTLMFHDDNFSPLQHDIRQNRYDT